MSGHIPCVICLGLIRHEEYRTARCWTDPHGVTCAAHQACLTRLGETDLQLPPDPGETTAAIRPPPPP